MRLALVALVALVGVSLPERPEAAPDSAAVARWALVIGVNKSNAEDPPLRYADDDAALYFQLFRTLGARTHVLTRFDAPSRRLHAQAVAEARRPTIRALNRVTHAVAAEVRAAASRGVSTQLYLVYAGHGVLVNGVPHLTLDDQLLSGAQLARLVIEAIDADVTHVIVDACNAAAAAGARGPGGSRRAVRGFAGFPGLPEYGQVGLLLATSTEGKVHEWDRLQAGVFSHEVRSGLYGAADADGDGTVTYREIAAFVEHANATIPNERFRPRVIARPPPGSTSLVELPGSPAIEIGAHEAGRYVVESRLGVRLAQLHSRQGQVVRLHLPRGNGHLYLQRPADRVEYVVAPTADTIGVATLQPQAPRSSVRGAEHEAFEHLFELPFDAAVVARFRFAPLPVLIPAAPPKSSARSVAGWISVATGLGATVAGSYLLASAWRERAAVAPDTPQREVSSHNERIRARGRAGLLLVAGGVAAGALGSALLWWQWESDRSSLELGLTGAGVMVRGTF